ncbi:beta strand repeat-containing protein [Flavobacterium sp. 3HN19-14]|uniref:beta strand repeat-containing protein n=1 Tax=Flavobacterium sp. 3HN19-14 TaxID=3448133 RepID=UPI003EDE9E10
MSTQVESGGATIATYTDDYDGDTRNASTPDIGADEFTGVAVDLTCPSITYSLIANDVVTATKALSNVAITDATGVNTTTGTKPRLYFKKSTDANDASGWKFVEANGTTSPFDFTITYSLLNAGSVSANDIIQYFVVAQDTAIPTVSINSGTFAAAPTSVALTSTQFPIGGTINSYTIVPTLSGIKTVCPSGCDYTTLTVAGGAFAAINTAIVTGDITLQIAGDITTETGAVALNEFASPYTVTIKPTGSSRTISGTSSAALITLNAADRVTIDGSLGAATNTICPASTATRDLNIVNNNTGTSSAVVWLQSSGSNGATSNTIKNTNITGNANTTTLFGVGSGSNSIGTSSLGTSNNNNSYVNNSISKAQIGIYSQGASAAAKNSGTVIRQNLLNASAPNNLLRTGIFIGFDNGADVSGNNIAHLNATGTAATGIGLGFPLPSATTVNTYTTFTGNEVTGATVSNNIIDDILRTGDGSSFGICLATVTTSGAAVNTIANNSITRVSTTAATPSDSPYGILAGGGTVGSTRIYHNSISLSGVGSNSANTFGIAVAGTTDPTVDIRNNIVVNKLTSTTGKGYALAFGYSTFANLTSNNNDFFVTADLNHFDILTGGLTGATGVARSSWATTSSKDTASQNLDVAFSSATDLRPAITVGNQPLSAGGANILAFVPTDIDCTSRSTTPSIGFKEFSVNICSGATAGTATPLTAIFCGSGSTTINATGYSSGINTTYQWQSSPDQSAWTSIGSPSSTYTSLSTGTITSTTYYRLEVICTSAPATDHSTVATVIVNTTPTVLVTPSSGAYCGSGSVSLVATGATTYSWSPATGLDTTTGATVNASPTSTTTYTVIGTTNGCPSVGTTVTITVNAVPTAISISPASANTCPDDITTLTASGGIVTANATFGTGLNTTTGNTTGAALGPNPFQNFYGGDKQQWIYTASELAGLGFSNGTVINSIQFNLVTADPSVPLQNLVVKMKNSTTASFATTSSWESGLTTVKTASTLVPAVGVNTITLTSPFTWNGTDNLVVEVNYSNNNGGTSSTTLFNTIKTTNTTFTSSIFYRVDTTSAATIDAYTAAATNIYSSRTDMVFNTVAPTTVTWSPIDGLYTDPAATVAYILNTPATTVYAKGLSHTYTATAKTAALCSNSGSAVVTVNPASVGGTVSADQAICSGATPSDLTLSGNTGNVIKWQSSSNAGFTSPVDIADTTTTLTGATIGALTADTYFRAVVQSGTCTQAFSSAAHISINAPIVASVSISATATTICSGTSVTFTATPTNGGTPSYQWKIGGVNVPGQTAATFTTSTLANGNSVTVEMTSSATPCLTGSPATSNAIGITVNSCSSVVNVKVFVEGYYTGSGTMASVKNNQDFVSPLNQVEELTLELHNATTHALVATTTATLHTDGTMGCTFAGAPSGSFYIAVKGSNLVETWSATPQTVGAAPLTYDFTTSAAKAYTDGSQPSVIEVEPGVWAMYSGDVNQDGVVDGSDAVTVSNDAENSLFGS